MIRCQRGVALVVFALLIGPTLLHAEHSRRAFSADAHATAAPPTVTDAPPAPPALGVAALSNRLSRVEGKLDAMEKAPPRVSETPFGWPQAAAWLGTLILTLAGYLITAKASRQHAIDTEKLKLEFTLVRQRLRLFLARAEALAAVVPDVPTTLEAAVHFFNSMPTSIILLELAAKRVINERYAPQVYPTVNIVSANCRDLFQLLLRYRPDKAANMEALPQDAVAEIADGSLRLSISLSQLVQAVDVLAEAALERNDPKHYFARLDSIRREAETSPVPHARSPQQKG